MPELKALSREGVARALDKAERYRLLNEPAEAESICLDVLRLEPDNQQALVALLLSLTDQFDHDAPDAVSQAQALLPRLKDDYARAYYAGIVAERRAQPQAGRRAAASPTASCARRCRSTRRRRACGRPATTTRCCASTPACASWSGTRTRRRRRARRTSRRSSSYFSTSCRQPRIRRIGSV